MREPIARLSVRRIEIIPAMLMLLALAGVCAFLLLGPQLSAHMAPAVFSTTYQFLVTAVLGAGVSVLFQSVTQARDVRERRRTLQREIHAALVAGYNDVKRARRLLRARARSSAATVAREYDTQLEAVSSAQLAIELATRRVELNRTLFPNQEQLLVSLNTVCKYVNSVVDEWEDARPRIASDATSVSVELPVLDAFLTDWRTSPQFRDGFKMPFDFALRMLEQALADDF